MKLLLLLMPTILIALIGCNAQTTKETLSLNNDFSKTLPSTALGFPSKPLFFSTVDEARTALVGYNYVLTKLNDGRIQANVSGYTGSGTANIDEVGQSNAADNIDSGIDNSATSGSTTEATHEKDSDSNRAENDMPFPKIDLPKKLNGQASIDALGNKVPEVAQFYGLTPERLEEILRTDSTAWFDEKGRLFYKDSLPDFSKNNWKNELQAIGISEALSTDTDSANLFELHSRPDSNRVIYLDFNGHTASNSAWYSGTLNAQPYDTDGNPNSFSSEEQNAIREIWLRVAEDYMPFDVDVTTQEPPVEALQRTGNNDMRYGTRAVVTRSVPEVCHPSCGGGIAYVNVFSFYSASNPDYYQPAWIFFDNLTNGHPKYVADATSHEIGHNLNLHHDGTSSTTYYRGHGSGATGWAPIMGSGYYKPVVQWSKGEYPDAKNFQDDIAVIHAAGANLRPDDYPDTIPTASPLDGNANSVEQSGVIETDTDVDIFAFNSGDGSAQFTVNPEVFGPKLDILAKLLDVKGNILAQSNPEDALSASLSYTLTPGRYFLQIEGVGKGDLTTGYSDYGSVGQYSVTGSYVQGTPSSPPTAIISAFPATGEAPLSVTFDGNDSNDADSANLSYTWNFGDGQTEKGKASTSHVYDTAGNKTATLTVTDDSGLQSSTTQAIEVSESKETGMSVSETEVYLETNKGGSSRCYSNVTINYNNAPVDKALVFGTWTGSYVRGKTTKKIRGSNKKYTDASGVVSLAGPIVPKASKGTCTFTVTKVTKTDYSYTSTGMLTDSLSW